MKNSLLLLLGTLLTIQPAFAGRDCDSCQKKMVVGKINEAGYKLTGAPVKHNRKWGQREFEIRVHGAVKLPPTNPGMPLYFDSPGFQVVTEGNAIRVVVPDFRVRFRSDFRFDALSAYLQVNTSDTSRPMIGVYKEYSILSQKLTLPYNVQK